MYVYGIMPKRRQMKRIKGGGLFDIFSATPAVPAADVKITPDTNNEKSTADPKNEKPIDVKIAADPKNENPIDIKTPAGGEIKPSAGATNEKKGLFGLWGGKSRKKSRRRSKSRSKSRKRR